MSGPNGHVVENLDKRLRHDIRSHLNGIDITAAAIELMLAHPDRIDTREILTMVKAQRDAIVLINDLLNLTKID